MKVEEFLRIYRSKERMTSVEVKSLEAKRCILPGYLCLLRSKMDLVRARVAENVEDGFYAFCRMQAGSLSDLAAAR